MSAMTVRKMREVPAGRGAGRRRHRGPGAARPPGVPRQRRVRLRVRLVRQRARHRHGPGVHDPAGARPLRPLPDGQHRRRDPGAGGAPAPEDGVTASASADRQRTPDRLRPPDPQGGRAVHPRPGPVRRRRDSCRGCCTARSCAARWPTRGSSRSTPRRRSQHPKVHAVITGARSRGARPGLDADAVRRRPGGARHRQGPLPGPGGRVRDRATTATRRATRSS